MQVSQTQQTRPRRTATILVVEDDESVQELLKRWLAKSGRNVVTCGSFEEARAYLATHSPDVLVTDIRLHGYNGLQLVTLVADRQPAMQCLVITGYDDSVLRKEAERMHTCYLLKPFGRDDFLNAIENLVPCREDLRETLH